MFDLWLDLNRIDLELLFSGVLVILLLAQLRQFWSRVADRLGCRGFAALDPRVVRLRELATALVLLRLGLL